MTKYLYAFFLALLLASFSVIASAAPRTLHVHLEGIADGDTIYVRHAEQRASYRVRLAMIDAPESKQAYGPQAKQALQQLLRGAGILTLQVYGSDRYGRLIAVVEDERKRNINLLMVNQGAAWVYSQYARRPEFAGYYDTISTAENNARRQRLGLWANPDAMEPWRFRRSR
ncbi:thermonuclease family protein (plasmid) [Stutzerimonas frequens]|uniref:thermonuclease family protein n=1 Tax=Stutzerimonas frequens TaxID=2968969 RepID=UPI002DBD3DA6|nr:thermonuclease family protein [Stutzerimonas frequens]WRW29453.1 thermonuclease family protein [Stutzerimonas frequens]